MGATLTDTFKKKILLDLDSDIGSNGNYYIGIGRSEQWNATDAAPDATNNQRDVRVASLGLQSIKSAEDRTFTIPRNNWASGTTYSAYDDYQVGYPSNKYYVITEDNRVYICLEAPSVASTVKPNETYTNQAFKTSDGYVWKFLYAVTASNSSKFLSANFMPVHHQSVGSGDATLQQQKDISDAAVAGQISGIAVDNGGSGYTGTPTVTITGNGVGATATASTSGGVITAINLDSSADSCRTFGRGYTMAGVTITGGSGTGAVARVKLAPRKGHGFDPRDDLKSTQMMFNTKPAGAEGNGHGKFIVGQDFRQVMLLRNPYQGADSSALFTQSLGRAGTKLTLNASANNVSLDEVVVKGSARGIVDQIDSSRLFIHQNDSTGYGAFTTGALVDSAGNSVGTISAVSNMDVFPNKFDVYYLENRAAVTRAADQTEDIKVVISI